MNTGVSIGLTTKLLYADEGFRRSYGVAADTSRVARHRLSVSRKQQSDGERAGQMEHLPTRQPHLHRPSAALQRHPSQARQG